MDKKLIVLDLDETLFYCDIHDNIVLGLGIYLDQVF